MPVVSPSIRRSAQIHSLMFRAARWFANGFDFRGEQCRAVGAPAAGAGILAEEKDLVHPGVEGSGARGVEKFVDQIEEHGVDLRMPWTVAAAIDAFVLRVETGRFVEFRVRREQARGVSCPGLVPQEIDHGNQLNIDAAASVGNALQVDAGKALGIGHLWTRVKR